jgi:membrane-bound lytic murein transglycosylase D
MKKLLAILAGACTLLGVPPLQADESAAPDRASVESRPDSNSVRAPGTNDDVKPDAPGGAHLEAAIVTTALTPAPQSLWKRVRNGFALPEIDSPLVARHEAWFLNHPDYFQRMIERSRLYLYFIVEEIEKRNMPMEVALLPMIESAYNPVAYSRARAVGIWQFMPATGKRYGLQQNWWYDGRRDVLAATGAALDYLEKLHEEFNDWQLALAAYNWGVACHGHHAMAKPTRYENRMPRETHYLQAAGRQEHHCQSCPAELRLRK